MVACSSPLMFAQQPAAPIGELFPGDATTGQVQPAATGMNVVAGSEVSAGVSPALLKLQRGGQVRICPHSNVTVNAGRYGLMFAMGSGMVEIDYTLTQRGTDFVLTPDFSIQLSGPGRYHFALGADKQGDTCMKSLAGNSSPVMVSEQIGSASYRVRAQDSVLFHAGRVNGNTPLESETCGCPAPEVKLEASNQPPTTAPAAEAQPTPASPVPVQNNPAQPVPADRRGQVHVEVDTPFVFNARDAASVKPYSIAKLKLSSLPNVFFVQETVDPVVLQDKPTVVPAREVKPAPEPLPSPVKTAQNKEKKGFFGKLKGMFSGLFHR